MRLYPHLFFTLVALAFSVATGSGSVQQQASHGASAASPRYRAVVSTDIGGSDPDDHQSMVHLMLYADTLDFEGLISTQPRGSKKAEILKVIGLYEHDYPNLKTYSDKYPTPDALRAITKTGVASQIGASGFGQPTEGSDWIIQCARRDDPRPLYVLVWGGFTMSPRRCTTRRIFCRSCASISSAVRTSRGA